MSLILSGPRRVYVLLFFWERLADPCADCPRSLGRIGQALGTEDLTHERTGGAACCHVVMVCRVSRVFGRRLVGLSLLILDPHTQGRR